MTRALSSRHSSALPVRLFSITKLTLGNFRKILTLDEKENFSSIQLRLFMRYCAKKEIEIAHEIRPKKKIRELVAVRPLAHCVTATKAAIFRLLSISPFPFIWLIALCVIQRLLMYIISHFPYTVNFVFLCFLAL